ncbi:FHA domain-containing protein [Corallococcus exercitus]|uniref:FHA domain-containing protein n=1 Tax=Corallococcus exercitus TaxID=2316736 RepID=UPI0035D428D9
MAAIILEARCVAPFVVRVRFSDGMEGEASLEPCLFDWDLARIPDLTPELREWLRSPEHFATVRLDADAGTLAWGDARPFPPSIVYWRVERYRVPVTVRLKDGTVLAELLLGGRREVWTPGLTVGSAPGNTVVVDRPGVAPHHVRVRVGGGHHPCYFVEVLEGTTTAGDTTSSTPGETWRVPMREGLRLELADCAAEIG